MPWIALLFAFFVLLGVRLRPGQRPPVLTLLVVIVATLGFVFLRMP